MGTDLEERAWNADADKESHAAKATQPEFGINPPPAPYPSLSLCGNRPRTERPEEIKYASTALGGDEINDFGLLSRCSGKLPPS